MMEAFAWGAVTGAAITIVAVGLWMALLGKGDGEDFDDWRK